MKKLPTIKGLLIDAAQLREDAAENELRAKARGKDPRSAHEAGEDAKRQRERAGARDKQAEEAGDLIVKIEALIDFMVPARCGSPNVTLAKRALEEASMRLRREIGDAPDKL